MYCKICGEKIYPINKRCPSCGEFSNQLNNQNKHDNRNNNIIIIIIASVVLLCVLILVATVIVVLVNKAILSNPKDDIEDIQIESPQNDINTESVLFDPSEYILPYSNSSYLSASDISGLSGSEIRMAINEIYARHGRLFDDSTIQSYFDSKSWYNGTTSGSNFSDGVFNDFERANIDFLSSYEN